MIIRNYAASIAYPSFPNFQRIFLPFMKALNRVVRFVAPYQKAISRKSHLKLSVFPFQSIIIHQNLLRQPVLSLHMSLKPPGSGGVAGRWKPHEPTNTGCGRRYGKRPWPSGGWATWWITWPPRPSHRTHGAGAVSCRPVSPSSIEPGWLRNCDNLSCPSEEYSCPPWFGYPYWLDCCRS